MKKGGYVWQCKCGNIEYDDLPEDCPKCFRFNAFKRVPDDMIEEKEAENILALNSEEEDE